MRLFVLDKNGRVVFEFNTENENEDGHDYRLDSSRNVQADVIKVIKQALQFLSKKRRVP